MQEMAWNYQDSKYSIPCNSIARNGIWREMESVRNGICKECNLQVKVTFNVC